MLMFLVLAALNPHVLAALIAAHPAEAFVALGVVLNILNGLLPATIRTGPVGTALHVLLDRVTILTRRNAPGTLKWPIIAGSILRAVADSLNPPEPLPSRPLAVSLDAVTRPEVPAPFDPGARQTIAPEVVALLADEVVPRDPSQRGSISLRALLAVALLSLAVIAASCIPARRFVLDHTDGVPARVSCVPRRQACLVSDAGVYLPVVYSDECRPWPTLPLRPDGTQRTCATGEGCVVDGDAGIAHCTAADASVGD